MLRQECRGRTQGYFFGKVFLGDGALEEDMPNFLDGRAGLGSSGGRRDLESLELWEEKTSLGGWPQALVYPTGDMTYTEPCRHALPSPIPLKPVKWLMAGNLWAQVLMSLMSRRIP